MYIGFFIRTCFKICCWKSKFHIFRELAIIPFLKILQTHSTIYSATTFLEKCRKVVLEKWFGKLGFFFLVNHFSQTIKKVDLYYKTTFFLVNHFSRTTFLKPDFSNHFSRTTFLQLSRKVVAE